MGSSVGAALNWLWESLCRSYGAIVYLILANYKYLAPTEPQQMTLIILNYPAGNSLRRVLPFVISASFFFSSAACAKRSRAITTGATSLPNVQSNLSLTRININTASAKELETLPGIGKGLAERIIEHRQTYGPFAKPEHLIMVRGISEHRFQAIRDQITVE
jgi:competence ComEA-like helix-hairpin-helix protein